jgi:hypothetical protein
MGLAVVTVAAGGLPVCDVTATTAKGMPVTEAANGYGLAVTKVALFGMPVAYETIGISGSTGSAFNSADLSNVTLTNGNLTATGTAQGGVRSTGSIASGKNYFEYTLGTVVSGNTGVGLCTAGANLATVAPAPTSAAIMYKGSGAIWIDNAFSGSTLGARVNGDTIGIAVDKTAKLIWFRAGSSGNWNGSGTANPATGVGGVSISAANLSGALYALVALGASGDSVTSNFGASSFVGSVPSGFTSGWPP